MRSFQFHLNGRPMGPVRERWEDAAADLCRMGYGEWIHYPRVIHSQGGAAVINFGPVLRTIQ